MIKLFHGFSPNGLKVQIALEELRLRYEIVPVRLSRGEHLTEEFTARNPMQKIPVLVDGDITLWESGAILTYLAEKTGRLLPDAGSARAEVLKLMFFESASFAPAVGGQGLFGQIYRPEEQQNRQRIEELKQAVAGLGHVIDTLFSDGRRFVAGDLSIADIQLFPGYSKAVEAGFIVPGAPASEWLAALAGRPAFRKGLADFGDLIKQAA